MRAFFHRRATASRWESAPRGGIFQSEAAEKVSQDLTLPVRRPVLNQRWRWALVPCVKLSGTMAPPPARCRASSPILEAAFMADSTSPCSRIWRALCARFAQTPARQSACSSSLTDRWLYSTLLTRPRARST